MRLVIGALASALLLPGCIAGTMVENLSMKGEPIAALEQRYGQPDTQSQGPAEGHYVWVSHAGRNDECRMMVDTDAAARVTDVKMVGRLGDCRDLRHPHRAT